MSGLERIREARRWLEFAKENLDVANELFGRSRLRTPIPRARESVSIRRGCCTSV